MATLSAPYFSVTYLITSTRRRPGTAGQTVEDVLCVRLGHGQGGIGERQDLLGCPVEGPHLHVRRRTDNPNRVLAKSRHPRCLPVTPDIVAFYTDYQHERWLSVRSLRRLVWSGGWWSTRAPLRALAIEAEDR